MEQSYARVAWCPKINKFHLFQELLKHLTITFYLVKTPPISPGTFFYKLRKRDPDIKKAQQWNNLDDLLKGIFPIYVEEGKSHQKPLFEMKC